MREAKLISVVVCVGLHVRPTPQRDSPADRMPQKCSSVANLFPVRPGVTLLSCFFLARASMRRRSEHSSQMMISEGLPHILQTWCASSGWGSDRRGTIFMLCLLSNLVRRRRRVLAVLIIIPLQSKIRDFYQIYRPSRCLAEWQIINSHWLSFCQ